VLLPGATVLYTSWTGAFVISQSCPVGGPDQFFILQGNFQVEWFERQMWPVMPGLQQLSERETRLCLALHRHHKR
jgi:hypothetical protein